MTETLIIITEEEEEEERGTTIKVSARLCFPRKATSKTSETIRNFPRKLGKGERKSPSSFCETRKCAEVQVQEERGNLPGGTIATGMRPRNWEEEETAVLCFLLG